MAISFEHVKLREMNPPGKNSFLNQNLKEMDEDIYQMSNHQLIEEIKKLRAGIRDHRDSSGQDVCWHHPRLWSLLPEKIDPKISVPDWPEFMKGCVKYRQSLDMQKPKGQVTDL